MAESRYLISSNDWRMLQDMFAWWRSQPGTRGVSVQPERQAAGRPNAIVMLLSDLTADAPVNAALLQRSSSTETQLVTITGYAAPNATQSQFKIGFQPSDSAGVEWTDTLQADDTAATVQAALEGLLSIDPDDVLVQAGHRTYDGEEYETYRWIIHFRGKYVGQELPLLQTQEVGSDSYADSVVTEAVQFEDTGKVAEVFDLMPLGSPTPLRRGAICLCGWFHGFGYVVVSAECRDLVPQPASG